VQTQEERLASRVEQLAAQVEQLRSDAVGLRAQLAHQESEAVSKEAQLRLYASDLRETFKQERARTQELHRSYMLTVRALADAVEARDAYTGKHAERVAAYALCIAEAAGLGLTGRPEIEVGFLLHDLGKVAVPDAILFKPGKLTPEERLLIEQHPVTGTSIVREIEFLGEARDVIRSHHERWDGGGYPDGLAGEEIPLSARVFAVADVLDALTTERPYRHPSTFAQARVMIEQDAGTHFDPAAVAAFALVSDERLEQIRTEIG
jgi:putative nucleotidyltransferase with HDIG domain